MKSASCLPRPRNHHSASDAVSELERRLLVLCPDPALLSQAQPLLRRARHEMERLTSERDGERERAAQLARRIREFQTKETAKELQYTKLVGRLSAEWANKEQEYRALIEGLMEALGRAKEGWAGALDGGESERSEEEDQVGRAFEVLREAGLFGGEVLECMSKIKALQEQKGGEEAEGQIEFLRAIILSTLQEQRRGRASPSPSLCDSDEYQSPLSQREGTLRAELEPRTVEEEELMGIEGVEALFRRRGNSYLPQ